MTQPDAIARWKTYPAPNAKRTPCPFCGRSFIVVCSEQEHASCGNFWERRDA